MSVMVGRQNSLFDMQKGIWLDALGIW
jgi:hypothetical protein